MKRCSTVHCSHQNTGKAGKMALVYMHVPKHERCKETLQLIYGAESGNSEVVIIRLLETLPGTENS